MDNVILTADSPHRELLKSRSQRKMSQSFSTEFLALSHIILEGEMRTSTENNVSIFIKCPTQSANTDGGDRCDAAVPAGWNQPKRDLSNNGTERSSIKDHCHSRNYAPLLGRLPQENVWLLVVQQGRFWFAASPLERYMMNRRTGNYKTQRNQV